MDKSTSNQDAAVTVTLTGVLYPSLLDRIDICDRALHYVTHGSYDWWNVVRGAFAPVRAEQLVSIVVDWGDGGFVAAEFTTAETVGALISGLHWGVDSRSFQQRCPDADSFLYVISLVGYAQVHYGPRDVMKAMAGRIDKFSPTARVGGALRGVGDPGASDHAATMNAMADAFMNGVEEEGC